MSCPTPNHATRQMMSLTTPCCACQSLPASQRLVELTARAAEDVAAELVRRWPNLPKAVDGELCVTAATEFVNDWADSLLGAAMEAARVGGDHDDVAA